MMKKEFLRRRKIIWLQSTRLMKSFNFTKISSQRESIMKWKRIFFVRILSIMISIIANKRRDARPLKTFWRRMQTLIKKLGMYKVWILLLLKYLNIQEKSGVTIKHFVLKMKILITMIYWFMMKYRRSIFWFIWWEKKIGEKFSDPI